MKKADKILGLTVLGICLILFLIQIFGQKSGESVIVEVDGEIFGTYALAKDTEILINDTNCIIIEDGTVRMAEAACPDHLCIRQGTISKDGQMIVCLPNRVTVRIAGDAGANGAQNEIVPDAVAG